MVKNNHYLFQFRPYVVYQITSEKCLGAFVKERKNSNYVQRLGYSPLRMDSPVDDCVQEKNYK